MTEHPLPEQRIRQAQLLESLSDPEREEMAFLFRTGNLSYRYYADLPAEPTPGDFEDWLSALPDIVAEDFRHKGLEACKGVLGLRRHTAERHDLGLSDFMRRHLSDGHYRRWCSTER